MTVFRALLMAGSLLLETACAPPPPALVKPATIKDIMDSMVDPSGDFIFASIQQIADEHGVREKAQDGRGVGGGTAPPFCSAGGAQPFNNGRPAGRAARGQIKNPAVENEPAEIQKLLDADRTSFIRRARRLQDAASQAMTAADAKDKAALFRAIDRIDKACENCHLHYWYPNDKRARQAAIEDGITDE